ncbi:hypothetical protein EVAR_64298_1 [Eumeta japonica]|uniref:Uncharacterized protein n=1 Tax=Eumeta variegata TaxID=151549 RepID=A0A4C1ZVV8_EUMVA|nr:hypothetical protein EVAR_64298_1 [Eumeta japonica]
MYELRKLHFSPLKTGPKFRSWTNGRLGDVHLSTSPKVAWRVLPQISRSILQLSYIIGVQCKLSKSTEFSSLKLVYEKHLNKKLKRKWPRLSGRWSHGVGPFGRPPVAALNGKADT